MDESRKGAQPGRPDGGDEQIAPPEFDWFGRAMAMRPKSYGYLERTEDVWAEVTAPLRDARVALLSTAGVHRLSDPPFEIRSEEKGGPAVAEALREQGFSERGDWSVRLIPSSTPGSALTATHGHYNTARAREDINCVFPIDRLRELAGEGVIGDVAPTAYGLMGFIPDAAPLEAQTIPIILDRLKEESVDLLVAAPG